VIPYEERKRALLAGEISPDEAHAIWKADFDRRVAASEARRGQRQDSAGTQLAARRAQQAPSAGAHGIYGPHTSPVHPGASRIQDEIKAFGKPITKHAHDAIARGYYFSGIPAKVPWFFHSVMDHQQKMREGS
jgi:hypothetical protein